MNLERRIEAFTELGNRIKFISPDDYREWVWAAKNTNAWFTDKNIEAAFEGVVKLLNENDLRKWVATYNFKEARPKKVGVVMAGNIPMVGFHDFLSVLISGHQLYAKLSSQDNVLLKKISSYLIDIEKDFMERINFIEMLNNMDAVIATGSDNSAKYFKQYFSSIPNIIRQNRVSCAVIRGDETEDKLKELGKDMLQYFGLGCRSIAKLYVPENYDFSQFFKSIESLKEWVDMYKYFNNYDYNKSIYLLNRNHHWDNGFLLITENEGMVSPISVAYYEFYKNEIDLTEKLIKLKEKIQIVESKDKWVPGSISFGEAQAPSLWDYADGVDTLEFLQRL